MQPIRMDQHRELGWVAAVADAYAAADRAAQLAGEANTLAEHAGIGWDDAREATFAAARARLAAARTEITADESQAWLQARAGWAAAASAEEARDRVTGAIVERLAA